MSTPFKALGAVLYPVFALCFAALHAHADAFPPIFTTTGCNGPRQLPTAPHAASADDSEKNAIRKDAAAANACVSTAENGRSLTEAPCDLSAGEVSAREGQVYAQNGLVSALVL
jgi:hypothetical protein